MTVQTDALDAACRRFPHMLTLAKYVEECGFDWRRISSDLSMLGAEYHRAFSGQAKAALHSKGSVVT